MKQTDELPSRINYRLMHDEIAKEFQIFANGLFYAMLLKYFLFLNIKQSTVGSR